MKSMRVITPLMTGLTLTGLLVTGCGTTLAGHGAAGTGTGSGSNAAGLTGSSGSNPAGSTASTGNTTSSGGQGAGGGSGQASTSQGSTGQGSTGQGSTGQGSNGNGAGNAGAGSAGGSANGFSTGDFAGWPKAGSWMQVHVKTVGQLPQGILGNALAMGPNGAPISIGGYTGQVSITNIYSLLPSVLNVANLPVRTHDAAAGFVGNTLYVYGGGQATSYNTVVAVENGSARTVATLSSPLSDAVSVPLTVDGQRGLALVGGYDGSVFRTDVAFMTTAASSSSGTGASAAGGRVWKQLFNLEAPVRYAAVASTGSVLYIAGGLKQQGLSSNVYEWSASTKQLHTIALPAAFQKAALYVAGPYLILIGGEPASGVPMSRILEIDTRTGASKVVGNFPTPIADMGYTQTASTGYLAGGVTTASDGSTSRSVYEITWQK